MIRRSIWEDTYYEYDGDKLSYHIVDDNGNVIFAGKAYKRPADDNIMIKINSICRNYLDNDLRPVIDEYEDGGMNYGEAGNAIKSFILMDNNDIVLEEFEFLYDWSYEYRYRGDNAILSKPINGKRVSSMFIPLTNIQEGTVVNYLYNSIGQYSLIDGCHAEYAVYYLNSYGGWDAFLFEGKATKKDTITQFTTDRAFNNQTLDYEAYRYVSEITTSYTLSTGWLTDEQAANFAKNLVGSNHVYLHDLQENRLMSAIITDSNVTYHTMRNNKGKMAVYQLNIKESQNKLRQ